MAHYINDSNIANYRKLIAASALDPARDEGRHTMLLSLLTAELAKDKPSPICGPLN